MNSRSAAALGRKQIASLVVAGGGAIFLGTMLSPFASGSEAEVVQVSTRRSRGLPVEQALPISAPAVTATTGAATELRLTPGAEHNPFSGLDFSPAPAQLGAPVGQAATRSRKEDRKASVEAVPAPPAPAPTAPPLPFKVIGAIAGTGVSDSGPVAFLQSNESLLVVRAGEQIGGQYLVESISRERIEITYLPLKQRQFLMLAQ